MSIWLCLLIPALMGILLIVFFRKKVLWWELALPFAFTVIFILVAKWIAVTSLTYDTEFLGGYVTEVRYYEDWNEYVHRTCTRSCGKNCRTIYDCSYVRYHPEYWEAVTTLGNFDISHNRYDQLVSQFKAKPQFKDLHRHYHSNDGDMYHADWRYGDDEGMEPVTTSEHYENKPKASLNVFHFDPVDTTDMRVYKPFEYPPITGIWEQECLLGVVDDQAHRALQLVNAYQGGAKQIRVFVLVFEDKTREAGFVQERYWQGSNKNELVVCVGVDKARNVQWVYDFSWTDRQDFKIDIRSFIESQKHLDLISAVDFIHQEIDTKWVRKNFKDFDYLHIEPTIGQVIVIMLLTLVANGLIGWWVVENEFQEEVPGARSYNRYGLSGSFYR